MHATSAYNLNILFSDAKVMGENITCLGEERATPAMAEEAQADAIANLSEVFCFNALPGLVKVFNMRNKEFPIFNVRLGLS